MPLAAAAGHLEKLTSFRREPAVPSWRRPVSSGAFGAWFRERHKPRHWMTRHKVCPLEEQAGRSSATACPVRGVEKLVSLKSQLQNPSPPLRMGERVGWPSAADTERPWSRRRPRAAFEASRFPSRASPLPHKSGERLMCGAAAALVALAGVVAEAPTRNSSA